MNLDNRMLLRQVTRVALAVLTFGLAACDPSPSIEQSGKLVEQSSGSAEIARSIDDIALNMKVEDALKADPSLKVLSIKVNTTDGVTTLSGSADTEASRDQATQVAMSVSGVKAVENRLVVGGA